jgi:hypothetical protein
MNRYLIALSIVMVFTLVGIAHAQARRSSPYSSWTAKDCNDLATSARMIAKARDSGIDSQKLIDSVTSANQQAEPRILQTLIAEITIFYASKETPDELASEALMDCIHGIRGRPVVNHLP